MSRKSIRIEVVYAHQARTVQCVALEVPSGATVEDALRISGLLSGMQAQHAASLEVGVWGHQVALGLELRDRDRVELYRRLTVDPKVARRQRFVSQGAKTAGLFAKRRAGAKPGY